jgi:DNA-binding NtrC family response regulator
MALLHQGHGVLDLADLPEEIRRGPAQGWPTLVEPRIDPPVPEPTPIAVPLATSWTPSELRLPEPGIDLREALRVLEYSLIDQALARTRGNRNQAARLLGLRRTTLVEKLKKRTP